MKRAHQPAEAHFGHDELNTLERGFGAGPVIEEEQNAGRDLNHEKKKRHAPEVVPDGLPMDGDRFLGGKGPDTIESKPVIQPYRPTISIRVHPLHCLETTMSSPERFTAYGSSGRGGGPATLIPFKSN